MSVPIVLSAPPVLPPLPENQWYGLELHWQGHDGTTWDLRHYAGGVIIDSRGVEGLHFPPITKHKSASRAISGSRLRGWRADDRPVIWPIWLYADGSKAWLARHRAFFKSLHPEAPGTWTVRAGSEERTLQLTGVFDESHVDEADPMQRGWGLYTVELEAVQPFWAGQKVVRGPWSPAEPQDFFGEDGGPPFYISADETLSTAAIPNPGDVDVYGIWRVVGPWNPLEIGVDEAIITVPFAIADGEVLVIDTDPRNPSATLDGVDVTAELGLQEYAPVPPGDEVPLHVAGTGTGSVSFEIVPLYFRAF